MKSVGSYERIAQKLLKGKYVRKPFVIFYDGKVHIGVQSRHLSREGRLWRLFWRLKLRRRQG